MPGPPEEEARAQPRARTASHAQAPSRGLLGAGGVLEHEVEALLAPYLTTVDLLRLSEAAPSLKAYRGLLGTIRLLRWHESACVAVLSQQRRLQELIFQHPVPMGGVLGVLPRNVLSTLRRLDFRGHVCAGASTWSALAEALENGALRGLEELRIEPAFTVEGARDVASALAKGACPSLRVLDLSGRGSPPLPTRRWENADAASALAVGVAEALAGGACPRLEVLRLDGKDMVRPAVEALGDALTACTGLRVLRLDMGDDAAEGLPRLLARLENGACPGIQTLGFRELPKYPEEAAALARAVEAGALRSLECLYLNTAVAPGEYDYGDASVVSLARAWQVGMCPGLRTLHLEGNGLTSLACKALAQATRHEGLPLLEELDLRTNSIGDEGVRALVGAWGRGDCPVLRRLNLSCTGTTEGGCAALAQCVGRGGLPRLETLGLSENAIGDKGVTEFVAAWRAGGSPDLQGLGLSEVGMSDEGCGALARGVAGGAAAEPRGVESGGQLRCRGEGGRGAGEGPASAPATPPQEAESQQGV
jgi:Ran GTPase-activating protein (RanGAP) involved in mRNA processing and transport